ncbi:multiple epidermal growth factor-like domains protein 11 isoform X2 [Pomacea canaliculata]|uniref:multiple epidermal growth factor-like domains protein 11 isoform X2 n=1 Tax=Pomacea canaliculata TaxID=400727 RepID=UPI000D731654|nr:multiple epidermal growth factor-like domains protein 11 isoform X2 [Pomacea canaliculata]
MHWSLLYFTYVWWEELARSCCEHRCCRSCTSCMCGGRGLYADVSIAAVVGSSLSPGIYLPLDTCRLPAVVNLSSSQTLLSSGYPATNSILTKTISGWIQMLRFLLFLLCVSRVLAKDTERCQGKDCEIKTWHNKNCRTNDDCNQPLAVCYENQCRCDPGYYYTTNDTCTSTCSTGELQSNFTEYPDSAIRGNHLDRINGISLEYCKGRCQTLRRCLTFDFKANGGQCRFHNVTAREAPSDWSPKTSTGWTHYQRSCKSTLATDDNWYNLLCNSRINCPDPNSDCLSGRCFCQLGFNFNEAMKKCVTSVLKTWHNASCGTDDDCDEPHGVCYKRVCRCHPGYYYTTQDTCTSTCSTGELQSNFTEYPDSALRGNLLDVINGISVEDCKGKCQADNRCLTFDFKAHGGLCRLHNVTAHESPSDWYPKRSKGWTHYQRSCKSTFASHDNWYNLLCNSGIDCYDRNSDCLSGRCFCQSGFKFNEAEMECRAPSELKTWHNTSCGTDDDCDEPHGVCYKRVCRCHPGYYYTTQDTCTSTCSRGELQSNFTEYPDSALRGNHLASSDRVSVDVCKGRCLADNRCLTFDFKGHGGLCRLHHVTALESSSDWSPKTSKGWTHYQRSCKSPFASNDTWYNLLCDSKIACPDRNSDCLSGRCMCHSGFKFNEATKKCVVTSELKTWHNTSCGTDDDCDEPHGVCYKHLCRCHPGYYYTTQDTCTSTCSRGECRATLQSIQTALYVETTLLARMESVWMSARAGAWPTIVASPLTSKPMEVSVGFIM